MVKLASAARIIQKPQALAENAVPGPAVSQKTDLFTTDELFGIKQGQYLKKNRSRVLADMETLFAENRWQDIVSLYHPVEEKVPELVKAQMAAFLLRRGRDYSQPKLKAGAAALNSLAPTLAKATDKSTVRGVEGAGTRIYFSLFPLLIRNQDFTFKGRNRRPPKDPVNALLSFVYTLLTNEVISAIKTCGLDPYLGALHEISYGRPSLACDLVEEYRAPVGDRFVLQLLNKKMIRPDDFIYRKPGQKTFADEKEMAAKRPVEMKPQLFKTFLAAYEQIMQGPSGYRSMIQAQVRSLAGFLLDNSKPYHPIKL